MVRTFTWNPALPPLSFRYNNQASTVLMSKWKYSETSEQTRGGQVRHCLFTDPVTHLGVTAHVRTFENFPAVEWVLEFANKGTVVTPIIEAIFPLDTTWPLPAEEKIFLHYAKGSACQMDDFLPITDELHPQQKVSLAPTGGRSSNGVLPFMNLQWPGGGFILAVGWSGQWAATFDRRGKALRVFAGMERTHLCLLPGEQIRTPRILLIPWHGDAPIRGNNLLRRIILAHYTPGREGEIALPPVAHNTMSSYYKTKTVSEEDQRKAITGAAKLGVEAYWLDACWYGSGGEWHQEVGNWYVNPGRFPRGLKPLSDAAHEEGMKFILWFEPERVL